MGRGNRNKKVYRMATKMKTLYLIPFLLSLLCFQFVFCLLFCFGLSLFIFRRVSVLPLSANLLGMLISYNDSWTN
ncbi:hypothetical protein K2173_020443 [Erythroxylum novogranatense]|uniref:Uncharacterized protein n=1 Tax=Erythroxylum novogranatense TaxID=1862640 RepID=A0AAV8TGE6_9ROSI|nr:hypothetical protein K2173_020443 [Erythroxylum novogranatense]